MGSQQGCRLAPVEGKGLGLVATRALEPGNLVVSEPPLVVLDPPTDRRTLLKALGCDWSKVGMSENSDILSQA